MHSFEFDTQKSFSNFEKHGIDFETAKAIWQDANFAEIPAKSKGEPRFVVIGLIADKHWSAVITYRKEKIRIISVRRSRKTEVAIYEG